VQSEAWEGVALSEHTLSAQVSYFVHPTFVQDGDNPPLKLGQVATVPFYAEHYLADLAAQPPSDFAIHPVKKASQSSSFVAVVLSVHSLVLQAPDVDVPKQYFELLLPTIADSQNAATPV